MIILDYSAVAIVNISIALKRDNEILTKEFALHMILNSIRASNVKFKKEFGSMQICCDAPYNWRKDAFEYYKYKRRKNKEKSDIDWGLIDECLKYTKDALSDGFPYNVLEVEGAEADDIIGTLAQYSTDNKIHSIVVSGDKDFVSKHSEFVCQWRPVQQEFIRHQDPKRFLKELIIRGDSDDGVPNIKSADDHFTIEGGPKQKSIYQKDLDIWLDDHNNSFLGENIEWKANYERNDRLINLDNTPEHIKKKSIELYENGVKMANKGKMTKFFMNHKLRMLHEQMNDFM